MIPFPYTDKDMSKNGVTFEVQQDGGVNIYGTATESVDFFLSMLDYGNDSIFNNGRGNGKILSGGKNGVEIEYHGTNKRLYLTIAKGKTVNTVIYPQLQNGSTSTPYEPYSGGKLSPSPEYPQEIKNVGKWNEVTQKYEVDVKIAGKNMIGEYNILDSKGIDASGNVIDKPNACISDLILIRKGKYHTLSLNNVDGIPVTAYLYDRDRKYIGYYFETASLTREFTLDKDCFIRFVFPKPKTYILSTNIQLELRKGKTLYEPQKEPQTLTLTSDRPITKWDKLVEQDGQIGWLYQSAIDEYSGRNKRVTL